MYRKTEADTILPPEHNPRPPASSYPEIDPYLLNLFSRYEHHTYLNRIKPKLSLLLVKNLGDKFYKCAHFDNEVRLRIFWSGGVGGGGYSWKFLVGVCRPVLQILIGRIYIIIT